jgi:hypothetical protein
MMCATPDDSASGKPLNWRATGGLVPLVELEGVTRNGGAKKKNLAVATQHAPGARPPYSCQPQ